MDRVPVCFIEETIWLLDDTRRICLYKPLILLDSLWGVTANRESELCDEQALKLYVWNYSGETRFCIAREDRRVSLESVYLERISRVQLITFGSVRYKGSEEMNENNHKRLCALLAKNVCSLEVSMRNRFEFNENLIEKMLLSLNKMTAFWCDTPSIEDLNRVSLNCALKLRSEIFFKNYRNATVTEKSMEVICTAASSIGFRGLDLNAASTSPITASACLNRILDCMEKSGIQRSFTFTACLEHMETVVERAEHLKCQFKYEISPYNLQTMFRLKG